MERQDGDAEGSGRGEHRSRGCRSPAETKTDRSPGKRIHSLLVRLRVLAFLFDRFNRSSTAILPCCLSWSVFLKFSFGLLQEAYLID